MPTIPLRGVGQVGVVSDINPQDTPLNSWTDALNVRFAEGVVSRYSVFKNAYPGYTYAKVPVGLFNSNPNGEGHLTTVFTDGSMEELINGATLNVTPAGVTSGTSEQITTTVLGGVSYVNLPGAGPFFRSNTGAGAYATLPGWASVDRCASLRSYKDFLIALNVTKAGIDYPGMIKWSDAAQSGAPPSNWNVTLISSLAGENVLNDIRGSLVDGLSLGVSCIVYGEYQTFRMDFIGTPFIFRTYKLFDDKGMIARNCAVLAEGKHYVFGQKDIYVHDGVSNQSLSQDRIAKRLFSELDYSQKERCFVYHDEANGEIAFCYPSVADDCVWPLVQVVGCNRAAVFNYRFNTWTFVDLPSVVGSAAALLTVSPDWESFGNWGENAQTWNDFSGNNPENLVLVSTGNETQSVLSRPYFLDNLVGGRVTAEVNAQVLWPGFAEATHRDMDELGSDLLGRKLISRLAPQFRAYTEDDSIILKIGQTKFPSGEVMWGSPKTFSGYNSDKYDLRINGRYISIRVDFPANSGADLSGYDVTMTPLSGR